MCDIHIENLTLNVHLVTHQGEKVPTVAPPKKPGLTPEQEQQRSIRKATKRVRLIELLLKSYSPEFVARINL